MRTFTRTVDILLVEDNPGDVALTREALRETELETRLHVVRDGVQAMAFLRQEGEFASAPRPDLILLDLNLPRKSGRDVLDELKSSTGLRRIPVVVLTTSEALDDIVISYERHANCYITKPMSFHDFVRLVRTLESFWFGAVRLPPGE
ncbi:MAG: response regulator [Armatimonadetes bacterium]|nr:response regulator [Armatimonadota bacterium]